jgi:hypothetical protein
VLICSLKTHISFYNFKFCYIIPQLRVGYQLVLPKWLAIVCCFLEATLAIYPRWIERGIKRDCDIRICSLTDKHKSTKCACQRGPCAREVGTPTNHVTLDGSVGPRRDRSWSGQLRHSQLRFLSSLPLKAWR